VRDKRELENSLATITERGMDVLLKKRKEAIRELDRRSINRAEIITSSMEKDGDLDEWA
jgi:hypothetical protein